MKEIKTYEDLLKFADSFLYSVVEVPTNLILCFELNADDYTKLMSSITVVQFGAHRGLISSEFFTLKYAQLTFKITIKK